MGVIPVFLLVLGAGDWLVPSVWLWDHAFIRNSKQGRLFSGWVANPCRQGEPVRWQGHLACGPGARHQPRSNVDATAHPWRRSPGNLWRRARLLGRWAWERGLSACSRLRIRTPGPVAAGGATVRRCGAGGGGGRSSWMKKGPGPRQAAMIRGFGARFVAFLFFFGLPEIGGWARGRGFARVLAIDPANEGNNWSWQPIENPTCRMGRRGGGTAHGKRWSVCGGKKSGRLCHGRVAGRWFDRISRSSVTRIAERSALGGRDLVKSPEVTFQEPAAITRRFAFSGRFPAWPLPAAFDRKEADPLSPLGSPGKRLCFLSQWT